jgi:hypothetical protein
MPPLLDTNPHSAKPTTTIDMEIDSFDYHPVFHVSCLKKEISDEIPVQNILPKINEEIKIIQEP